MTRKSERLAGLDVVRSIAVLLVVGAHSFSLLNPLFDVPLLGRGVSFIADHILPFSGLGVELFFVLSGYLIGNILIRQFMETDEFSIGQARNFWLRRWFRTLPNYWLILTVNLIVYDALKLQPFTSYQLIYYPFLQNLVHPMRLYFFSESWSLSVEEWFYLTLPVFMLVAARIGGDVGKRQLLLRSFVIYLGIFVLIRFVNAFHPINGPQQDTGIRKVVLFRLDAVMYGVMFAYFNYFCPAKLALYRRKLLYVSLAGAAVIYILLSKRSWQIGQSPNAVVRFLSDAFMYAVQPIILACCLPYAGSIKQLRSRAIAALSGFISRISYSMYLIHYSLVFLLLFYPARPGTVSHTLGIYILYWLVVIGGSSVIYYCFELPFMRLRDRLK